MSLVEELGVVSTVNALDHDETFHNDNISFAARLLLDGAFHQQVEYTACRVRNNDRPPSEYRRLWSDQSRYWQARGTVHVEDQNQFILEVIYSIPRRANVVLSFTSFIYLLINMHQT